MVQSMAKWSWPTNSRNKPATLTSRPQPSNEITGKFPNSQSISFPLSIFLMWTRNERKVNKEYNSKITTPANIISPSMHSCFVGKMELRKNCGCAWGLPHCNQICPPFIFVSLTPNYLIIITHTPSFLYCLCCPTFMKSTMFALHWMPVSLFFHWHFNCSFDICLILLDTWNPCECRFKTKYK